MISLPGRQEQIPTSTYLPTAGIQPPANGEQHDLGAPLPGPKIMPKHDEDLDGIGKKNIGGQLGSVHVYSTQLRIKKQ
jgi:hypothetical protein